MNADPADVAAAQRIIAAREAAKEEQRARDLEVAKEVAENAARRKEYGPPWKDPAYADREWHPDYVPPWPEELPEFEREPAEEPVAEAVNEPGPSLSDMEKLVVDSFENAMKAVKGGCGAETTCPECQHVFACPNDVPDHTARRAAGKELMAYLTKRAESGSAGVAGGGDVFTWDDEAVNSSIVGRWVQDDYAKVRAELVEKGVLAEHDDEEPDFDDDDPFGDE